MLLPLFALPESDPAAVGPASSFRVLGFFDTVEVDSVSLVVLSTFGVVEVASTSSSPALAAVDKSEVSMVLSSSVLAAFEADEVDPGAASRLVVCRAAVLLVIGDSSNPQYWSYAETAWVISADTELQPVLMQLVRYDDAEEAKSRRQKHLS